MDVLIIIFIVALVIKFILKVWEEEKYAAKHNLFNINNKHNDKFKSNFNDDLFDITNPHSTYNVLNDDKPFDFTNSHSTYNIMNDDNHH
ncbi:hypothetical protein [Photobacterium aquimaris]|uniref:Uncharacterized protein n=1 Tax=Photobacterium aquimaris TaxID=512643 RepID=A0A2T3I0J7_9GAMM|nr:hypothetical protein [Photobacterium aquimaris]OBU25610.1 hypothetical protein AYY21_08495 [Photobacterium aquimaris]PQJ37091.1 hypothetical protein BTN98_18290 [Photobacterium aquimaris]PSU10054.1 hypothetical protein C0W81_04845 [Photobacterium aquimaris]